MINIFLDDERVPKDVKWIDLPKLNWIICRDFNSFKKTIEDSAAKGEFAECISFDHDLGDEAYKEIARKRTSFDYENLKGEKTGMDCAKFLVDFCEQKGVKLPKIYVHSMNPIGRENIVKLFQSCPSHLFS
jgi:hypothetical protein